MTRIDLELQKVSAECAHLPPDRRAAFLLSIINLWTRQLNMAKKGKPSFYTQQEFTTLLSSLKTILQEIQNV